jgi:ketosteroid isomerase-like protein
MSGASRNKEIVRRHLDLSWNKRDVAALDSVWAKDAMLHLPGGHTLSGADSIKMYLDSTVGGYTERELTIDESIAEEDMVAVRWSFRGVDVASKQPVAVTGMDFYRIVEGQIAEEWFEANLLGLMQQLKAETT